MSEWTDLDEVPILVGDLRAISRALNAAYCAHAAFDLQEQYRNLNTRAVRHSNLTRALETSFNKVEGYLAEVKEEENGTI